LIVTDVSGRTRSSIFRIKMRPIGCPETSVTNYQSTLHISEEGRYHAHRGRSHALVSEFFSRELAIRVFRISKETEWSVAKCRASVTTTAVLWAE
jgi:hypothetical protein